MGVPKNGTLLKFKIGGVTVAHATSADFGANMATRATTSKDSAGATTLAEGLMSFDCSFDAWYDPTSSLSFSEVFGMLTARTAVTVIVGEVATGEVYYTGSAFVTSCSLKGGVEDTAAFSGKLSFTGVPTEATAA
jgi:hypothetical protein